MNAILSFACEYTQIDSGILFPLYGGARRFDRHSCENSQLWIFAKVSMGTCSKCSLRVISALTGASLSTWKGWLSNTIILFATVMGPSCSFCTAETLLTLRKSSTWTNFLFNGTIMRLKFSPEFMIRRSENLYQLTSCVVGGTGQYQIQ